MKFTEDIIPNLTKKYKPSSIKTFQEYFKRIPGTVRNYKKTNQFISSVVNDNTRKAYLASILAVLKAQETPPEKLIKRYQKDFDILAEDILKKRAYKRANQKEEENYISWEDILKIKDKLQTPLNSLVLGLFTDIPPLRGSEFSQAVIKQKASLKDKKSKQNTFSLKEGKFYLNSYKTDNLYGPQVIDIPEDLIKKIKQYMKTNKIKNGEKLNLTSNKIHNTLRRIFRPKYVSTQMLRKIYISDFLKDKKNNIEERKKLAKQMLHSLASQEFIYNRFA